MSRALSQMLADQYYHSMVAARRRGPVWSVTDLGELAVRLGSIVWFDRRGDVILLDDFESGLPKWAGTYVGDGASVGLSNVLARSGGWSVLLTAGSTGGRSASITHVIPYPVLSRFGLECSFCIDDKLDELTMAFSLFDGVDFRTAALKYDAPEKALRYLDDVGYQDLVTGLELFHSGLPFWTWKVVANFSAGTYERVVLNEAEHDLSGTPLGTGESVVVPNIEVWIQNKGLAGENAQVYLDDVIITQNEPENTG